jgi:hypothetical protein
MNNGIWENSDYEISDPLERFENIFKEEDNESLHLEMIGFICSMNEKEFKEFKNNFHFRGMHAETLFLKKEIRDSVNPVYVCTGLRINEKGQMVVVK